MNGELPVSTRLAVEHLIREAAKENITIAGFAFSEEPLVIGVFGNCENPSDTQMYRALCNLVDKKVAQNGLTRIHVGEVA